MSISLQEITPHLELDLKTPQKHFTSRKKKALIKLVAFVGVIGLSVIVTFVATGFEE